jgi:hypothetical protein
MPGEPHENNGRAGTRKIVKGTTNTIFPVPPARGENARDRVVRGARGPRRTDDNSMVNNYYYPYTPFA